MYPYLPPSADEIKVMGGQDQRRGRLGAAGLRWAREGVGLGGGR
jgi:hypothetical protein